MTAQLSLPDRQVWTLLVEVESPRTSRDRILKPHLYAAAGIPAYWRVELDGPAIVMHMLEDGVYREVGDRAFGGDDCG